jgi:hypothetical protein
MLSESWGHIGVMGFRAIRDQLRIPFIEQAAGCGGVQGINPQYSSYMALSTILIARRTLRDAVQGSSAIPRSHLSLPEPGRPPGGHLDDVDCQDFLKTLAEACQKTGFEVHAYCLIPNHFHLGVETPKANLVARMAWLLSPYAALR